MRRRKGQSILEYVIVLTVIVAAIIVAAANLIRPAVDTTLRRAAGSITGAANRLPQ